MFDILMPQAGQSMEEGTIVKWHKAEGDQVKASEVLLEVETDKAVVEVEAGHDGVLRKILVSEGTTVPVKTRIALIGAAGEAVPSDLGTAAPAAAKPAASSAASRSATSSTPTPRSTPSARASARSSVPGRPGTRPWTGSSGGRSPRSTTTICWAALWP